jgi:uncharacterized protein (TIGR02001 family)
VRRLFLPCLCLLLLLPGGRSFATESGISATVGFATDYVWRGRSESRHRPAWQGEFDWWEDADYAGVWISTVDFGDGVTVAEVDPYVGTAFDLEWASLVVGLGATAYPVQPAHADDNDVEAKIGLKRGWGAASLSLSAYQRIDLRDTGTRVSLDVGASQYYEAIGTCDLDSAWRVSLALADRIGGVGYLQATATVQYAVDDHLGLLLSYAATNRPQIDESYRPTLAFSLRVTL